jgi:hypothetical protein
LREEDSLIRFGENCLRDELMALREVGLSNFNADAGGQMRLGVRTEAPKSGNDLHPMSDIAGSAREQWADDCSKASRLSQHGFSAV